MEMFLSKQGIADIQKCTIVFLLFCTFAFFSSIVKADTEKGYLWLASQQSVSGHFSDQATLASSFQASSEAVNALLQANKNDLFSLGNALSYLNLQYTSNTESIARLLNAGVDDEAKRVELLNQLLAMQNEDGGFSFKTGFDSSVLDTSFALLTLSQLQFDDSQVLSKAMGYLSANQTSGGGFFLSNSNQPSIYLTAMASKALQGYIFKYRVGDIIDKASDFILSDQASLNNVWVSSIALQAVIPVVTDSTAYAGIIESIIAQQLENGSWEDDVYVSALALNALYLAKNIKFPVDPSSGAFSGSVTDASNQLPLSKVEINVVGNTNIKVLTDEHGKFHIENLAPGSYQITYSLLGYGIGTINANLEAGQLISLGKTRLQAVSTESVLYGVITDATNGLPLSGVLIKTEGEIITEAMTEVDGSYRLVTKSGTTSVSVSLTDYDSVIIMTNLVAGVTSRLSSSLYKAGTTPDNLNTIIKGIVIDDIYKQKLVNVSVSIQGYDITVLTNSQGEFTLESPKAEAVLSFSLAGYSPIYLNVLSPLGAMSNIGVVPLSTTSAGESSSIFGLVSDEVTGKPIAGALVTAEGTGVEARTNADGVYELVNITTLDFSLFVKATGFMSKLIAVKLETYDRIQQDINLTSSSNGGVEITELVSDQTSYSAYTDVVLNTALFNSSAEAKNVRVVTEIFDAQNEIINSKSTSSATGGLDSAELIPVLPQEVKDLTTHWYTGIQKPGSYSVIVKVYDGLSTRILAEKKTVFSITATRMISQLKITPKPLFAHVSETANVELNSVLSNRSNVPVTVKLGYNFIDSNSVVIKSGVVDIVIEPEEMTKTIQLTQLIHTFLEKGVHSISFEVMSATKPIESEIGSIIVSPTTRLEVGQDISPKVLIPNGNKRISVKINLQGVEQ